jgi:membrane fusion protein, multidrug efflux system
MSHTGNKPLRRQRPWLWLAAAVAALAAVGAIVWARNGTDPAHAAATARQSPVPVTVVDVGRRDVPIHISGLGTVQASENITIRSQVDGVLQDVLFTEGQQVHRGDVLAKIDPRLFKAALDQAIAKKAQDQAQLIAADKDLTRFKTLGVKGFETQQNVDQQQGKVDQLKASIEADEAAIETAQTQLDYATIVAPSDGRIGIRLVDPGNIVHAADQTALATLTQTQPSAVLFTLPARSLEDVRDAMRRGPVEVTAFDSDNRRTLATGTLLLIDNSIDQTTATMRLKAMFPNGDDALWPGEFVNARILLEIRHDALVVPAAAVQRGPDGLFAWVITADGIAQMRPITVGPVSGDLTIVASGLTERDRVVTDGQYRLQQGAPLTTTTAPAGAGSHS